MLPDWLQNSYSQIIRNPTGTKKYFLVRFLFQLLSYPVALISCLRNSLYKFGLIKKEKIDRPVISIGNISLGGTGKTPCCIYLLEIIIKKQNQVALISRGYGDDESMIYQKKFPNIKMAFQSNRVEACNKLIKSNPEIQCFLLDDAYQHQKIKRDYNILLINSIEPFGYGYHLPRGYLRESLKNINRADLIILTHSSTLKEENLKRLHNQCQQFAKANTPVIYANHTPEKILTPDDEIITLETFLKISKNTSTGTFCGIANPQSFHDIFKKKDLPISTSITYGDHHKYNESDFQALKTNQQNIQSWITTEKDGVKIPLAIRKELNIYILKMTLNIIDPEDIILKKIDELLK
ncbi:MAG: tetraacyldisaccharide 4'-kinase [Planctomycetota bacterium]|nr:MAG: tetraacyldisaccharide 4'-kinase [Planctomycetota bacterium]